MRPRPAGRPVTWFSPRHGPSRTHPLFVTVILNAAGIESFGNEFEVLPPAVEPDVSGDHGKGLLELGHSLVRGEDDVEAVMDEFARHPPCRVEGSRALLDHFALDSLGHERESACVSRWGVGFLFGVGDVFCQLAPSGVVVE